MDLTDDLFLKKMQEAPELSWRANVDADGTGYQGYFVAGIDLPTGTIKRILPHRFWTPQLDYLGIRTSNKAPRTEERNNNENSI